MINLPRQAPPITRLDNPKFNSRSAIDCGMLICIQEDLCDDDVHDVALDRNGTDSGAPSFETVLLVDKKLLLLLLLSPHNS